MENEAEPLLAKKIPQNHVDQGTSRIENPSSESIFLVKFAHSQIGPEMKQAVEAEFEFEKESRIVFTGSLSSNSAKEVKFDRAILELAINAWVIEIPFKVGFTRDEPLAAPRWLSSLNPPAFIPIHRPDVSSVM